jgi:hypothetical protein
MLVWTYPVNTVVYRPFAKRWLCKQQPLLGNARNVHTCNNKTTGLCYLFLGNGSVNTHTTIEYFWTRCFLFGPCKVVIRKTIRAIQLAETQNYWVFGLCQSSSILDARKHNVSETGSVSVLRWGGETPTLLGPLESDEVEIQFSNQASTHPRI